MWSVTRPLLQECTLACYRLLSAMTQAVPPILSITPSRALVDEKFQVLVENLPPGCPVTLHSLHHSEDKDDWEAYGHYVSDHRGVVSVTEDLSFGGTYTGKEPMGLLWSMRPVPGSREGLRLRKINVCTPMLVNISVHSGHEDFRDRTPLASALAERWYMAPGVKRIDINKQGVQGTLFIPPGPGPFPTLLDMWGGGVGLLEYRSALLASRGYVSFSLDYLRSEHLSADVEFKYFETAFNIIRNHPQVIPDRVGILGISLGSTVAFNLTAYSTIIKPRCIVCISSNHYHPPGTTLKAGFKILSKYVLLTVCHENLMIIQIIVTNMYHRHFHKAHFDENNYMSWRSFGLDLIADPSNNVEVGRINCPMLLVNGCDDQNWPTVETAEEVARLLREGGKEHLLSRLAYPGAGHLIEPPFSPHFRATKFIILNSKKKVILLWGGHTKAHSDAQEDSWRKILSFLQLHLYHSPSVKAKL
ncbi:acyl-coenzyme A thioesterase 4-like isoform X2 [Astatotilapia calliptera]|uniref:Acyl-CoA thioesterase 16 n=2 Tax=Astatotilapia calliptera TaxID=8154 RepID=A0AAX7V8K5_ASTCA|nr:acyl-coenzyme A thioesterase 4-like isoform X2 [Astatotilapia calliptera]